MRYFKYLLPLLFASCLTKEHKEREILLGDVLKSEILKLTDSEKSIEKTVYLNNSISDTAIKDVNWEKEFSVFLGLLPSNKELVAYKVKEIVEDRKKKIFHTLEQENKMQIIEQLFIDDVLQSIRIEKKEIDYLSYQTIQLDYQLGKSLGMRSTSKIKGQDEIVLESFVRIK